MAAVPAAAPSVLSMLLKAAAVPAIQRAAKLMSAYTPHAPPKRCRRAPQAAATSPAARRKASLATALTGARSSMIPRMTQPTPPAAMAGMRVSEPNRAVPAVRLNPARAAAHTPSPPRQGTGCRCALCPPGRSRAPVWRHNRMIEGMIRNAATNEQKRVYITGM